jgi:D-xylose 1-dehydrogenase (NADP+, D-xylono-1,5-lactone-forming)
MTSADRVRWGILGTARINDSILEGARLSARAEVVAVGSRDADRAAGYAAEHGIPVAHGSYQALLADPRVEAVYVSLPNSLHHAWTMAALAAGKHVLCEKPYSRRPAEVEEAWGTAADRRLVLAEAFMWRQTPLVARLLAELPSIGTLQLVRASFSFSLRDESDIRVDAGLDGGSLMDVGCYCVSAARLLAGEEPDLALATADLDARGVDRRMVGLLRFPGGVLAQVASGFTTDHRGLEAVGTEGSLRVADPWHGRPSVIVRGDGTTVELDRSDPYALELDDVSAAIREGRAPLLSREDALGQARTIAALYASVASGRAERP